MIVLDTHALVWWAAGSADLSKRARETVKAAARAREIVASAISVFEIATAVRRGRLSLNVALDLWLDALGRLPELRMHPVTEDVARMAGGFDESVPGDPADRIIAATALVLNARLVTADGRLTRTPGLNVVW